jgi:hypothetical protein
MMEGLAAADAEPKTKINATYLQAHRMALSPRVKDRALGG